MRDFEGQGGTDATTRGARPVRLPRTRVAWVALLAACALCLVAVALKSSFVATGARTISDASEMQDAGRDFSKFSHATDAHRGRSCDSCHQRADNSTQPRLPGHKACTDCHLQQFVSPNLPMCSICHTNLDSRDPPVKNFPRLASFNAKFDHAQHTTGGGRPEQGCVACHQPARRGVALTIPAGLDAHAGCYQCHTPQAAFAGRDMASCGVCHTLARYARTGTGAASFRVGFSHATHGPRQRLDCAACHSVRAGASQGAQVSSPRGLQHFAPARAQSCATCHNNRRSFGGEDFGDCKRCHKGQTFRF